jgi:hypothetical protein
VEFVEPSESAPDLVNRGEDVLVRERTPVVRRSRNEEYRHLGAGGGHEVGAGR